MGLSRFNTISDKGGFLQCLDGRVKTLIFLSAIIVSTILTHWYLVAGLWLVATASFFNLNLPWNDLLRRLYMPFGIAWLVLLSLLFTNGSHTLFVISLGPIFLTAHREGLQLGILLLIRIMAAVTLGCILSFSTPMIEILETLRLCKIPSTIIDLAAMMHRYVFIIEETAHNMRRAQLSRMGDSASWLQQVRDTGSAACYVIIKSLDRSVKIYNAMLSRGYNENSTSIEFFTDIISKTDWHFAILIAVLLIVLVIANIMI